MNRKIGKIISGIIAGLAVSGLFFCGEVSAETRYISQKYSFSSNGRLSNPLQADFGSGNKKLLVEKKEMANDKSLLLVALAIDDDDVFALQLFDSKDYSIYKLKLRDNMREEIVVLGLGPITGKKVQLREVYIIAENEDGEIKAMPVKGFTPKFVLNAPLQLDKARNIILPTQVGEKTLVIGWNKADGDFAVVSGAVKSSASVEKDDGVFDEE